MLPELVIDPASAASLEPCALFAPAPREVWLEIGFGGGEHLAAQAAAQAYRNRLAGLQARYGQRSPVTVFYQIWDQPLYTLNDAQIASDAIRVCGGRNVIGGLKVVAPEVSLEALLAADRLPPWLELAKV